MLWVAGWTQGVTTATETTIGDRVMIHGFGIVFGETAETRRRSGALANDSFTQWRAYVPALFGDSGGRVLHAPTGKALGLSTNLTIYPTGLVDGPTIESVIADLAEAGFHVSVVTADYDPPLV